MDGKWNADSIQELVRGYQLPLVVLALVRARVFDRLMEHPATVEDLSGACGVDPEALSRLLRALDSVGIVQLRGEIYSFPSHLAAGLGVGIGSRMDGLRHAADGLDKWMNIHSVLVAGHATYPDSLDVTVDPDRNEDFIRAMHAHAGPAARRFTQIVPREGAGTFLDLGGGPGTFCFALLSAWPGLSATLADLPLTLRITRRLVSEEGLEGRLTLLEADFYRDRSCDLGGPYDLVLVSAVIHAEGEDENRDLLSRVRRVVAPGGRIVVRERLLATDGSGPPASAMFDVHMLVSTRRGRCYTLDEVSSMLLDAGFEEPHLLSSLDEGFVMARAGD